MIADPYCYSLARCICRCLARLVWASIKTPTPDNGFRCSNHPAKSSVADGIPPPRTTLAPDVATGWWRVWASIHSPPYLGGKNNCSKRHNDRFPAIPMLGQEKIDVHNRVKDSGLCPTLNLRLRRNYFGWNLRLRRGFRNFGSAETRV